MKAPNLLFFLTYKNKQFSGENNNFVMTTNPKATRLPRPSRKIADIEAGHGEIAWKITIHPGSKLEILN